MFSVGDLVVHPMHGAGVIDAIVQMAPQRLVYVSCDPGTLARDVKLLTQHGYTLTQALAVDMFPQTPHVETVCQLVLRNPVTHINIDVDVEEMVQDKRGLATYEQIKDKKSFDSIAELIHKKAGLPYIPKTDQERTTEDALRRELLVNWDELSSVKPAG